MGLSDNTVLYNEEEMRALIICIKNDDFFSKIIDSRAFQRLKDISFLGSIGEDNHLKNDIDNRYDHALTVAAMAKYISDIRGYSKSLKSSLIVSALLHDIGHLPFSHSIEPSIKKKFHIDHHSIAYDAILGVGPLGKDIYNIIKNDVDIKLIIDILNGSYRGEGADLFQSKINIDTIDGIDRTFKLVFNSRINPLSVLNANFFPTEANIKNEILDNFWRSKAKAYFFIEGHGLKSDLISRYVFEKNPDLFSESDLFLTDSNWRKKDYAAFSKMQSNTEMEDTAISFSVTRREFYIDENKDTDLRYIYIKKYASQNCRFIHVVNKNRQDSFIFE